MKSCISLNMPTQTNKIQFLRLFDDAKNKNSKKVIKWEKYGYKWSSPD